MKRKCPQRSEAMVIHKTAATVGTHYMWQREPRRSCISSRAIVGDGGRGGNSLLHSSCHSTLRLWLPLTRNNGKPTEFQLGNACKLSGQHKVLILNPSKRRVGKQFPASSVLFTEGSTGPLGTCLVLVRQAQHIPSPAAHCLSIHFQTTA